MKWPSDRVSHRPGHFMPASLIDSQFATLESPVGEPLTLALNASERQRRAIGRADPRLVAATRLRTIPVIFCPEKIALSTGRKFNTRFNNNNKQERPPCLACPTSRTCC